MVELSDYVPINLICLAVLGALLLRRLVRMERFHWPRVTILTILLWAVLIFLFSEALGPGPPGCVVPIRGESEVYPITET
jgi:hypothetical protein